MINQISIKLKIKQIIVKLNLVQQVQKTKRTITIIINLL